MTHPDSHGVVDITRKARVGKCARCGMTAGTNAFTDPRELICDKCREVIAWKATQMQNVSIVMDGMASVRNRPPLVEYHGEGCDCAECYTDRIPRRRVSTVWRVVLVVVAVLAVMLACVLVNSWGL